MEKRTSTTNQFILVLPLKRRGRQEYISRSTRRNTLLRKGIDLIVVDCDGTQTSFKKLRDRDRALIEEDPQIAESIHAHFERFQRPSYRIIAAEPKDALRLVNSTLNGMGSSLPDMVIFDFPGHSSTKELLELSIQMDFIICPIEADVQSLTSSLAYAKTIRDIGVSTSSVRIQDIILVWNKVDRRARSLIIDEYTKYVKEIGLSLFDAQLYSSVKFSRELGQAGVKEVFDALTFPQSSCVLVQVSMSGCLNYYNE